MRKVDIDISVICLHDDLLWQRRRQQLLLLTAVIDFDDILLMVRLLLESGHRCDRLLVINHFLRPMSMLLLIVEIDLRLLLRVLINQRWLLLLLRCLLED